MPEPVLAGDGAHRSEARAAIRVHAQERGSSGCFDGFCDELMDAAAAELHAADGHAFGAACPIERPPEFMPGEMLGGARGGGFLGEELGICGFRADFFDALLEMKDLRVAGGRSRSASGREQEKRERERRDPAENRSRIHASHSIASAAGRRSTMPAMAHHPELHTGDVSSKLNWLRASVLGANDGVISMAALLVGVAGAAASAHTLLITGVAGILAGAFSMAVGEYVSVSSQRDTEKALLAKERYELEHFEEGEFNELVGLYEKKGLARDTARQVARELTAHDAFAAHAEAELGIDPDNLTNPWHAGLASAVAYTLGGIVPTIAIVLPDGAWRIPVTFAAVLIALIATGAASARASGAPILATVMRVVAGGALAMAITYAIGRLFDVSV